MSVRVESKVHFTHVGKRQRKLSSEPLEEPVESGRIPRITRMLALAHRFDRLIREGTVVDQADLARLGHVSRARVTQVLTLMQLAPDIQEAILFLPRIQDGREVIQEHEIRPIAYTPDWKDQRKAWAKLVESKFPTRKGARNAKHEISG